MNGTDDSEPFRALPPTALLIQYVPACPLRVTLWLSVLTSSNASPVAVQSFRVPFSKSRLSGRPFAAGDLGELIVGDDLDRDAFLGLGEGL